jgi:hypothetical protein
MLRDRVLRIMKKSNTTIKAAIKLYQDVLNLSDVEFLAQAQKILLN